MAWSPAMCAARPRSFALAPLRAQAASFEAADSSLCGITQAGWDGLPRGFAGGNRDMLQKTYHAHKRCAGWSSCEISAVCVLLLCRERVKVLGKCLSLSGAWSAFLSGEDQSDGAGCRKPRVVAAGSRRGGESGDGGEAEPLLSGSIVVQQQQQEQQQPGDRISGPSKSDCHVQSYSTGAREEELNEALRQRVETLGTYRDKALEQPFEQWVVDGEFLSTSKGEQKSDDGDGLSEDGWDAESSRSEGSIFGSASTSCAESIAIAAKEPVYEVLEVTAGRRVEQRTVSRRQLLRSSGLRLRDMRRIDPSLWSTTSLPGILVRDRAILLNLGSLRAIATPENVLVFDQHSVGARTFLEALHPRVLAEGSGASMPFELEVVEAALVSRTQRLENMLQEVEPRVKSLLAVLPTRYTADVLEELRLSKQALVELSSKAGSLQQMLLELLEHQEEIHRISIMGMKCSIRRDSGQIECDAILDKQAVEDKEEEIEMLLEFYLQRCDSCHNQAQKLLDSAREMEDSISVNLSSRRLEVSRLELLLQVGTFCSALGALVAGIFGMNLRSYLEEHVLAFWITTSGIIFGGFALFIAMFSYLKIRRIL